MADAFKAAYKRSLSSSDTNLWLTVYLISGKDAKATKTDMINVLTAAMHWESLNMHVQFITSLGAKEREARLLQRHGVDSNMYLRSGEIQVSPDWSSFRNISESMILFVAS
jgi:hypothetical protein